MCERTSASCVLQNTYFVSVLLSSFTESISSNVIGRIAKTGKADIQITHDEYMSRRLVQIDVVKGAHGIEHRLVEINSKNIVVLNGSPIQRNDILQLKFGDCLTLGKTDIYLEETDDEATQIV